MGQELVLATASVAPSNFSEAIRLAEIMATGKLVPAHLQKSPGDCLMVIEQAMRWGMSPLAVAQCTSVIHGKLMYEGKLVAAALNTSGVLSENLDFEYSGQGDGRKVKAVGRTRAGTVKTIEVELKDARTSNDIWKRQPDQQLAYHAARVWARRHAPEVILGVYTPEEMPTEPAPSRPQREPVTLTSLPVPEPQPPVHEDKSQDRPRAEFEVVTWDGEVRTFDKASDYLTGLREAFDGAVDKAAWWADHVEAFNELHSKVVQSGKNKQAIAAFGEVSRHINDTLAAQQAA